MNTIVVPEHWTLCTIEHLTAAFDILKKTSGVRASDIDKFNEKISAIKIVLKEAVYGIDKCFMMIWLEKMCRCVDPVFIGTVSDTYVAPNKI
jgi:hypothetical protein